MTTIQALRIKVMRCRWDYTYRKIAQEWYNYQKKRLKSYYIVTKKPTQEVGINLCNIAQQTLNETWYE